MTIPNLSPLSQPPSFGAPDFPGRADSFLGDLVTLRNELTAVIAAINAYVPPMPTGALMQGNNLSDLPNRSAARGNLGLRIGQDVQAQSSNLNGWAGVSVNAINAAISAAQTASTNAGNTASSAVATANANAAALGALNARTWQDMSASRASDLTVYTNGTGREIQVSILYAGDFDSAYFEVSHDNGQTWVQIYYDQGDGGPVPMTGVSIPPGTQYRSKTTGGTNDPRWYELR